eukprot:gb/GECG01012955.1/.p1 GENE.gb/GECG01012955.1/~~gb/GECG01012955.1/.p1  ORF type:complete len:261 (+),score=30.45 gb/GECG01012955.1/:1-783(+)
MRKSLKGGRHGRAPSMGGSSSPTPLSAHLPMASRRRRDDDEPDHPHLDAMVFRSSSLNPNTRKEDLGNFTGEKTRKKKTRSSCMARVCGGRKWEENARIVNQTLLLQREMRRVSDWYPGSYFIAIIGPTGKVWAVVNDSDRSNYHLLYPIASVKNSSLELSNQMVQNDCAAIHIKGSQHLLTMLSFGPEKKYTLALYSRMSPRELKGFDVSTADQCVQFLLDQIYTALVQLQFYKDEVDISKYETEGSYVGEDDSDPEDS